MEIIRWFIDFVLHLDTHLNTIIAQYGVLTYLLLFAIIFMETGLVVTPFLPGDSLLFAAGALAASGNVLNILLLYVIVAGAAILGDTVNYWIGNKIGPRAFSGNIRFLKKEYLERTERFYQKHGGKTIFLARFIPIIRTFAPFVAGIGTMSYSHFISYNVIGGLVWSALFLFGGYFFGNIPLVKNNFSLVIVVIIAISLVPVLIEFIRSRQQKPRPEAEISSPSLGDKMKRDTLYAILRWLFQHLTRYEVSGAENFPSQGAVILATNHMSALDTPLLMITTPRTDLIALVADKHKVNPLFAFVVVTTGSIWIDRSRADLEAFRGAREFIKKGGVLGIAPEGTRSTVHALQEGKPGAAYLAEMARAPIVPVAITGTEDALKKIFTLRRPRIHVQYGKPFTLPHIDRADRDASLQRNTDEIMCRIALMLPPAYRGFYANHPRLLEMERAREQII